jgi:protein phosphatase
MTDLVAAAHKAGGSDNITLVLADVIDPGLASADVDSTADTKPLPAPTGASSATPASLSVPDSPVTPTSPTSPADRSADAQPDDQEAAESDSAAADASSPASPDSEPTRASDLPNETTTALAEPWPPAPWAMWREKLLAAPAWQGDGRETEPGLLLGAAARTTPLLSPTAETTELTRPLAAADDEPDDPESQRYRPTTGRRRRGRIIGVVLALLVVIGGAAGALLYGHNQYYVGVNDGYVTIFRGFTGTIAGLPLQRVVTQQSTAVTDLPIRLRDQLADGIPAADVADADRISQRLAAESVLCLAQRAERLGSLPPSEPTSPSVSPTPTVTDPTPSLEPSVTDPTPSLEPTATATTPSASLSTNPPVLTTPDDGC